MSKPKTPEQLVRALVIAVRNEQNLSRGSNLRSFTADKLHHATKKVTQAQNELLAAFNAIKVESDDSVKVCLICHRMSTTIVDGECVDCRH